MSLRAVIDPSAKPCKICGAPADLFGAVDFHKSCVESKGLKLSLSGIPVYYRRCTGCEFVFTNVFDDWSPEDFKRYIYNDDYLKIDPDYCDTRPAEEAKFIDHFFGIHKTGMRLLDYGGGSGLLAGTLRQKGYAAETFDPFSEHNARPAAKADLVTAFEVVEHAPQPYRMLEDMISLLNPDGAIFFSTLLQPGDFEQMGLNWWYVAPRNGHISIYSPAALKQLFQSRGFQVVSATDNLHIACRGEAAFVTGPLRHLQTAKPASSAA
jgi:2-polyprenyl-6-hydroxyphenyl methylase/3-demethylubiquinone-9 3-methyltransferase